LDRGRLAAQLTRSIEAVSNQTESAVVSLVGPWGSGKTSLLRAIESQLSAKGWHLARHNPWSYSSYETAVAGFFSELRHAVPDEVLGTGRREVFGEWAARLAPAGAVGGLVGIDATGALNQVASLITGDRSPEKLRSMAAEALVALEHPVLVVLDDLDRLEPGELLLTFKLVRLLGRLPNVYYLLAYDEATLADVLARTQLIGEGSARAQQYLEKMVQVRLDIPPLLPEQQLALVNRGIDDLCATHQIELGPHEHVRLQEAWTECLAKYLDQPRAIKRLFTQVDALWPEVAGEVDFVDFFLVTFLRTFERGVYDLVIENRNELLRGATFSLYERRGESNGDRWNRWQSFVKSRGARYPSGVALLLSELFLYLRGARENTSYSSDYRDDVRRRRGLDSEEFFDRYTQVGVPASDLSDQLVAAAVAELEDPEAGPSLALIEEWFQRDAAKVTRKLDRSDRVRPLPARTALRLLGEHYLNAMDQKSGFLGMSPDYGMLSLATRICDRGEPDDVLVLLQELVTSGAAGLALAADVVQKATYSDEQDVDRPWLKQATELVAAAIESHLRAAANVPLDQSPRLVRFMYAYRHLRGVDAARQLNWTLIESSDWDLADFLALLVPIGTSSNGRRTWVSMGEFQVGDVDALLGIDRVLEALPDSGDEPTSDYDLSWERRRAGVTLADRRRYALGVGARIRRERAQAAAADSEPAPPASEDPPA
jgi:hypothetical protein